MNIKQAIKETIGKIERTNQAKSKAIKARTKEQIRVNIHEKGQSQEQNAALISKFYSTKPQQLNTMQQALLEASC